MTLAEHQPLLTEDDVALLSYAEVAEDRPEGDDDELAGFRERLALGDLSW